MRVFNALTDPAAPDKTKMPHMGHFYFILVGAAGFEPTLTESESGVLPLNYAPMRRALYNAKKQKSIKILVIIWLLDPFL